MKTILPLLLSASLCFAENLEIIQPSHIGLNAQLVSTSAKANDQFKTDYGSSDIHTEKQRSISANVRNFGKTVADVDVTVLWIGKDVGGNNRSLLKRDEFARPIKPVASADVTSSSGVIKGSDMKLVAIGERYTAGKRIEGWVVTVRDGKTQALFAVKGSDTHLEEFARSDAKLGPHRLPETGPDGTATVTAKVKLVDPRGLAVVTPDQTAISVDLPPGTKRRFILDRTEKFVLRDNGTRFTSSFGGESVIWRNYDFVR